MPQHKSCRKRVKTSELQRLRNRAYRTTLRNAVKAVRTEENKEAAIVKLHEAERILDKAAGRRLIHPRNADRSKSRLASYVNKLG